MKGGVYRMLTANPKTTFAIALEFQTGVYLYNYIVQNPFQFDIIHYCFNKYTNYQTFIILPLFYIPQKSVELSHTL
jgi:hypothetical protein